MQDNYSYTALLQANADVYDNARVEQCILCEDYGGRDGGERVKGAFWKDSAGNQRRINL